MPLHSTPKGDSPRETLAQLLKRIENSGATVVQTIDAGDTWYVYASRPQTVEYRGAAHPQTIEPLPQSIFIAEGRGGTPAERNRRK